MRRIDHYIGAAVVSSMLLVSFGLVGIDAVFSFVTELEDLKNDYQIIQALQYILLTIPRRLYEFIPYIGLIASIVGLGGLASSNELTVLRAAGISLTRIAWAVIKPVMFLMTLGLLLGEFIAPYTEQMAQSNKVVQQSSVAGNHSKYGSWHREGNEFMYFGGIQTDGVLLEVTRYQFDDQGKELQKILFAKRATFKQDYWLMESVRETRIIPGERTEVQTHKQIKWETSLSPSLLSVVIIESDNLSISGLWRYAQYSLDQGLNADEHLLAFWKKTLQPATVIALVIVGISFVFGPLREVTLGLRIVAGIVVGIVFRTLQDLLGPSSLVFGFSPLVATLVPIAFFMLVGIFLIRKAG